jgi:2-dehydro-3-deoxyphosphogluconate aldolase/(4S)-4-hydroxy-2-oxoglutarate aldolase
MPAERGNRGDRILDLMETLKTARVVPVLTIERVADAVPLARALLAGGLTVLEVTLRTEAALSAIEAIGAEVGDATVGAGTITRPSEFATVHAAGAGFAVSPGFTAALAEAARATPGIAWLPGIATASELMAANAAGHTCLKFFPAEPSGGIAALKALAGPFPEARFCPTGGIDAANAADYLALPNVIAVGGSWPAPAATIQAADWDRITALARAGHKLGSDPI